MSARIRVENLTKIFGPSPQQALDALESGSTRDEIRESMGHVVALTHVSFQVTAGETFVVMGLSGSGKSTLIRCLNRLITPTAGQVFVDDEDIMAAGEEHLRELRRTKMSMVFQHFALFPHKTVAENVEYGLKVRGVSAGDRRQKALEALEATGLKGWGDRTPAALSGGMQQRVGLARALATDAEILLMDEAFSALDPLIRREMQDDLLKLQESVHKTIVFITHDLNEALKLGDHVAVMKDGAIVQVGSPEDIISAPADDYVADFVQDVDRGRVLNVGSIMHPADTLVEGKDSVRTALSRMRESGHDDMYLVQPHPEHRECQGGMVGLVTSQRIGSAVEGGVKDLDQVAQKDAPRAEPSATLMEIYSLCSTGLPVAVVDDSNCLMGVVNQLDVLAAISSENGAGSEHGSDNGEQP